MRLKPLGHLSGGANGADYSQGPSKRKALIAAAPSSPLWRRARVCHYPAQGPSVDQYLEAVRGDAAFRSRGAGDVLNLVAGRQPAGVARALGSCGQAAVQAALEIGRAHV